MQKEEITEYKKEIENEMDSMKEEISKCKEKLNWKEELIEGYKNECKSTEELVEKLSKTQRRKRKVYVIKR